MFSLFHYIIHRKSSITVYFYTKNHTNYSNFVTIKINNIIYKHFELVQSYFIGDFSRGWNSPIQMHLYAGLYPFLYSQEHQKGMYINYFIKYVLNTQYVWHI